MRHLLSVSLFLVGLTALAPSARAQSQYLICVDPGHGGTDPGACGCNLEEAAINLDTAQRLRSLLSDVGFQVIMTRSDDSTVSLTARTDYANAQGASRFVSIHSNAGGGTGTETYCHTSATSSSPSWDLATRIQSEMISAWGLTNRGMKQADFHVLRETNMSATLTELAFIDTCSPDANYLASDTRRQEAALAHLRALQAHLGLPVGPVNPNPTGTARGVIFEDKGVGTADMTTRLEGATVTVVQTGASVSSEASTGNWSFTLPVGSYTISAAKAGYATNTRSCDVADGQTSWCSLGLLPVATKGTAKGIVYVDRGDATRDPLPGATVTVQETGASATAQSGTGAFSFELDPGNYTLAVSASGYVASSRTCAVTAGQETDCTVGLEPVPEPAGPDASVSRPDAAQAGADAHVVVAADASAGAPDAEAGGADAGEPADASRKGDSGLARPDQSGCGGCGSAGGGSFGLAGFALALFAFAGRRGGRAALAAALSVVGLAGCEANGGQPQAQAQAQVAQPQIQAPARLQAPLSDSAIAVRRRWTVAEGGFTAPVLSPGGDAVALTRSGLRGLYLVPVEGGAMQTLTEAEKAGYAPRFSRDGLRIAYRVPGQPFDAVPLQVVDRHGAAAQPFSLHDDLWALQREDNIVLRRGRTEQVIAKAGSDRYFAPALTPDGRFVAYEGLKTGVHLYRLADGATVDLGEGSQPAASEDGRWLAFTRTRDDGEAVTAGRILLVDLNEARLRSRPVELGDEIALHPGLNAGRALLVYSTPQGAVRAAQLALP